MIAGKSSVLRQGVVLYEDSFVKISLKAQFQRHQGKGAICIESLQGPINHIESIIAPFDAIQFHTKSAPQPEIQARGQTQHLFLMKCVQVRTLVLISSWNSTHFRKGIFWVPENDIPL